MNKIGLEGRVADVTDVAISIGLATAERILANGRQALA
jgi:hypothetical protein